AQMLHTFRAREQILTLLGDVQRAEMEARSYGLSGRDIPYQRYLHDIAAVDRDSDALAAMVAGDPQQAAAARQLSDAIVARRARFEKIISDYRTRGAESARAGVMALVADPDRPVHEISNRMLDREAELLRERETASARGSRVVVVTAAVAFLGCLGLLAGALIDSTIERRRRSRSERALAEGAQALQHALHQAEHASTTLRRLARLAELLQSCRNMDEAITITERTLPSLLPDNSGCVALINASHNITEARMQWGKHGPELGDAVFAPDDCWALRRSQPHPGPGETNSPVCPHLIQVGITASPCLCLPLIAQGQALGVMSLCADAPIPDATAQLAGTIADQLALALGNLQLQASLRIQSIRDALTGLFNRRYLEASLPRELMRSDRRHGGLSVLMFDLDHFKRYNDTQGHDGGDALLAAFGALLAQSCRGEDIPCRYGGEEFAVVLVDADHAHALARAEAIRKATSELVVPFRGATLPSATVSIGVASFPDHGATPEVLLRLADQALYRAKQNGRNQVASANSLNPDSPAPPRAPQQG
ncbi:MAG TPA: GGDEF domain-containing protein, partial [Rhodanobacteraceae bacterium]|nr:GGDEF domain-containing protein [Rhodanobacteraceae bacterium]